MSLRESGLVPVYIGQPEPGSERERVEQQQEEHSRWGSQPRRVPGGLDWAKHGLQPRWLGMETSGCAVAIEPGFLHSRGADETARFLAGTRSRGELALVIAVIGEDDGPRHPLARYADSVHLGDRYSMVSGRRLPAGALPRPAEVLSAADRDLALRLVGRAEGAPWWSLHLHGTSVERAGVSGAITYEAEGTLTPLLVDGLGDPVVGVWTSPDEDQRWYLIPDATGWDTVLDWVLYKALPEFVPAALRRAHSPHFADPDLQTMEEQAARRGLEELEETYTTEKLALEQELRDASKSAAPVRHGLLYGTGTELVRAVDRVLADASMHTVDLDEELGDTKSADLLVSPDHAQWWLVEVKSASGAAPESLVGKLQGHLATWPQLRPDRPLAGGVLIVNHQHKLHPSERAERVYTRPEFLDSLAVTVVSSTDLFRWWRAKDWAAIHGAVLGRPSHEVLPNEALGSATSDPAIKGDTRPWRLSRWRRNRRGV